MSATAVREKFQVKLPQDVREAAGLQIDDQVEWRFEDGEIRGRKLVIQPKRKRIYAKLVKHGGFLVADLPKGLKLEPGAISEAVRKDRERR
jgi:bifunctional DNA-binding transcriptional regulator/antitoxin component of YhaV-PrlF toxin-antitoxin module